MRRAPQYTFIGSLLAIAISFSPGCREPGEETVTPVQLAPSDEPQAPIPPAIEQLRVRVVAKYPHAPDAFTQGLLWHDGAMYESTGRYGSSSLRRVRLEDGEVLLETSLDPSFFAEGLALVEDRLIQLTWRSGIAVLAAC